MPTQTIHTMQLFIKRHCQATSTTTVQWSL